MRLPNPKTFIPAVVIFTVIFYALALSLCHGSALTASWYSMESCLREGTSGIMANGRKLDDRRYTAASWDYAFGTRLKVTNLQNGRSVVVEVCDRGPNKKLYSQGRVIDLSKGAFAAIADLRLGVIPIKIERVN